MSLNYSQYLGAKRCCDLKTQGSQGPQGFQGTGSQGATGAQGSQGFQGATGATGAQGSQGFQGATGAQGSQGFQGDTGATGAQGSQGTTGDIGPQGFQGDTGAQGAQGLQGVTGAAGALGYFGSFYGDTGITPPAGLTGLLYVNQTDINNGVILVSPATGEFTIQNPGIYNIQFSAQLSKIGGGIHNILIWLNNSSGPISWTNTEVDLVGGSNEREVAAWNWFYQVTNPSGETLSLGYEVDSTNVRVVSDNTVTPEIPGIILTVQQVMNTQLGPIGAQGATGSQGTTGAQGSQGFQGVTGATGAQGSQGFQGDTGATGAQGSQGFQGFQGDTGAQGFQGVTGATGAQGSQGFQGVTGATGAQGSQGFQGDTGAQGFQGVTGATGAQGSQGFQGATGATGAQGSQGFQGATGGTPWIQMNGVGVGGTAGYTGIGVTGQDVLIYGNLLVTGGIDPIYLALTPQTVGPQGFFNPLWVDSVNGNALRSEKILLNDTAGANFTLYTPTEIQVGNGVNDTAFFQPTQLQYTDITGTVSATWADIISGSASSNTLQEVLTAGATADIGFSLVLVGTDQSFIIDNINPTSSSVNVGHITGSGTTTGYNTSADGSEAKTELTFLDPSFDIKYTTSSATGGSVMTATSEQISTGLNCLRQESTGFVGLNDLHLSNSDTGSPAVIQVSYSTQINQTNSLVAQNYNNNTLGIVNSIGNVTNATESEGTILYSDGVNTSTSTITSQLGSVSKVIQATTTQANTGNGIQTESVGFGSYNNVIVTDNDDVAPVLFARKTEQIQAGLTAVSLMNYQDDVNNILTQTQTEMNGGGSSAFYGASNIAAGSSHLLRLEVPVLGDALIEHSVIGSNRNLAITTTGDLRLTSDNLNMSSTALTIPATGQPVTAQLTQDGLTMLDTTSNWNSWYRKSSAFVSNLAGTIYTYTQNTGIQLVDLTTTTSLTATGVTSGASSATWATILAGGGAGTLQQTLDLGNTATGLNALIGLTNSGVGYTSNPQLTLNNSNATAGATTGVPSVEYYKSGRNAVAGDTIASQSFYGNDDAGTKTEFVRIETLSQNVSSGGNKDGSVVFKTLVNNAFNSILTLNGSSQEIEIGKPLDLNGNAIKTSSADISIDATASSGTGQIILNPKATSNVLSNGSIAVPSNTHQISIGTAPTTNVMNATSYQLNDTTNNKSININNAAASNQNGIGLFRNQGAGRGSEVSNVNSDFLQGLYLTRTDNANSKSIEIVNFSSGGASTILHRNSIDTNPFEIESETTPLLLRARSATIGRGNISFNPNTTNGDIEFNGANLEFNSTSGGSSGKYLRIKLNGTYYRLELLND